MSSSLRGLIDRLFSSSRVEDKPQKEEESLLIAVTFQHKHTGHTHTRRGPILNGD